MFDAAAFAASCQIPLSQERVLASLPGWTVEQPSRLSGPTSRQQPKRSAGSHDSLSAQYDRISQQTPPRDETADLTATFAEAQTPHAISAPTPAVRGSLPEKDSACCAASVGRARSGISLWGARRLADTPSLPSPGHSPGAQKSVSSSGVKRRGFWSALTGIFRSTGDNTRATEQGTPHVGDMAAEEQQADTSSASRLHPENSQADAAQQKHMNEHPSLAAPAPVLMLEYKMGCPEQAAAITPDQQQHLKAEREEAQPASPSYQLQLSLDFSEPEADMTEQKSYQPTSFQPLSRHLQASLAPSDSCLAASHQPALPPITYPGHESSDGAGPLPEPACVRQPSGASIQGASRHAGLTAAALLERCRPVAAKRRRLLLMQGAT